MLPKTLRLVSFCPLHTDFALFYLDSLLILEGQWLLQMVAVNNLGLFFLQYSKLFSPQTQDFILKHFAGAVYCVLFFRNNNNFTVSWIDITHFSCFLRICSFSWQYFLPWSCLPYFWACFCHIIIFWLSLLWFSVLECFLLLFLISFSTFSNYCYTSIIFYLKPYVFCLSYYFQWFKAFLFACFLKYGGFFSFLTLPFFPWENHLVIVLITIT